MATVALIQKLFRVLNYSSSANLHGFEAQIYDNFFEALEEAYNHDVQTARSLDEYCAGGWPAPDVIICAPLPEDGNPAPGLAELQRIRDAFPDTPLIVWSTRPETSLRRTCLEDFGCATYYTGTLLDAPEELPQVIAEALA
jgi:DNA-binding NarL/FixJ family response regulator